jgi:hypothetical protein
VSEAAMRTSALRDELRGWGTTWLLALLACVVAAAISAGCAPLSDPDLPIHLAVGQWIVEHRAVPFEEPFAWTRAGDPYYAYSWLWQTAFYLAIRSAGPLGLHVIAAICGAAIVLAGAVAGRALGLRPASATLFAVLSVLIAFESTPFLRPQLGMHVIVLLAWACTAWIASADEVPREAIAALLVLAAVAANTHITFPVVAAPIALLLLRDGPRLRSVLWASGALMLGWLLSPYSTTWPDLVRLLSGGITVGHAPVGELKPGFTVSPVAGLGLAALPLLAARQFRRPREQLVLGSMWLVGLFVFARYFKGLGPWWWCAIPLCVMALKQLPDASTARVNRAFAVALAAFMFASTITSIRLIRVMSRYEGDVSQRSLPSIKAFAAEPAARWLERSLKPGARGKLLTVFGYGSYLKWRVPSLSESIDSRGGIFPDSAALPDVELKRGKDHLGPWKSADLAVVPITYPVAKVLDEDPEWQRIGLCERAPWSDKEPRAGLWVRRVWWRSSGRADAELPANGILTF